MKVRAAIYGFTLIELVSVMVLLGILSAVVLPRFFTRDGFSEYAVRDQIVSAAYLAQQRAMYDHGATACYRLQVLDNFVSVRDVSNSAIGPTEEWQTTGIAIDGVTNTSIYFNGLGSPLDSADCTGNAAQQQVDIVGSVTLHVCLFNTGYIRAQACL